MTRNIVALPLDLSALTALGSGAAETTGVPLHIPLSDILPDPANARTTYDDANLRELAENIRLRGVLEPVSVRPRNRDGKYVLNSGWRRTLAARLAGKLDIPAFIDEGADDFDRYNVNEARENLSALDRAQFIKKQQLAGLSLAAIGARLSPRRSKAFVQQHLALLDLPPALRALYDNGICSNVTALYELLRLHRKNGDAVERAVAGMPEITGVFIQRLAQRIDQPAVSQQNSASHGTPGRANDREGTSPLARSSPPLTIRVVHADQHYQLVGEFITTAVATGPGRVWVRQGNDAPVRSRSL